MKLAYKKTAKVNKLALSPPRRASRKTSLKGRPRVALEPAIVVLPEEPSTRSVRESTVAEPAPTSGSGDTLQLYLREIGQVKLLTIQEENDLAARIKKGDEAAREHMIKANLRLVVKIARDYEGLGMPLLDLINEGNIGLMKGVERFDPAKGAKLSSYASWWIKQSIKRALANQSKTIRLPVHVVDKVAHIRRAEAKLRELLGREATDEEVADDLRLDTKRVRAYREASRGTVSLDAPLGTDEESNRVSDIIADTNAAAPFDDLVRASDNALVQELFAALPIREKSILALRFGLNDDNPKTLEEIGVQFKLTRERIRQIQEETLKKLRARLDARDKLSARSTTALAE